MRFFNKRNFLIAGLIVVTVAIAAIGAVLVYISSPEFKEKARQYAVREIEKETGGHVTISKLYWNLWMTKQMLGSWFGFSRGRPGT